MLYGKPASSLNGAAVRGTSLPDDAARPEPKAGLGLLEAGTDVAMGLRSDGGSLALRSAPGGMGNAGGAWPWPWPWPGGPPVGAGSGRGGGPPATLGLLALVSVFGLASSIVTRCCVKLKDHCVFG